MRTGQRLFSYWMSHIATTFCHIQLITAHFLCQMKPIFVVFHVISGAPLADRTLQEDNWFEVKPRQIIHYYPVQAITCINGFAKLFCSLLHAI